MSAEEVMQVSLVLGLGDRAEAVTRCLERESGCFQEVEGVGRAMARPQASVLGTALLQMPITTCECD